MATSNAFAIEKLRTLRGFGATVDLTHSRSGKITAGLIPATMRHAEEVAQREDYFYSDQFNNRDALIGDEDIGHELVAQFPDGIDGIDGIDGFCGAVGVAGMTMGVARVLKARSEAVRIVVLEPASSPTITQGKPGTHHV